MILHRDHYVCFDCRRGWKTQYYERKNKYIRKNKGALLFKTSKDLCSTCCREARQVGNDCRVPKHNDIKGWNLLKKLIIDCNFPFNYCTECNPVKFKGLMPKKLSQIDDFKNLS
jgi:hypothetical protein